MDETEAMLPKEEPSEDPPSLPPLNEREALSPNIVVYELEQDARVAPRNPPNKKFEACFKDMYFGVLEHDKRYTIYAKRGYLGTKYNHHAYYSVTWVAHKRAFLVASWEDDMEGDAWLTFLEQEGGIIKATHPVVIDGRAEYYEVFEVYREGGPIVAKSLREEEEYIEDYVEMAEDIPKDVLFKALFLWKLLEWNWDLEIWNQGIENGFGLYDDADSVESKSESSE